MAHGLDLLDMMGEAMKDVDDQIRLARLSYRLQGDMDRFGPMVVERLTFLFQAIGYGLGLGLMRKRTNTPNSRRAIRRS